MMPIVFDTMGERWIGRRRSRTYPMAVLTARTEEAETAKADMCIA